MSVKVAVIGMGHWGKNLVRNFYELGSLDVVCDSDETPKATIEQSYPGVEFTMDLEAVLADKTIQAVAIATPAVTHHMIAKSALEAGKDVYVEKPLATNLDDGEELVRLAKERGRVLMVGHILRYHPAVEKLEELIDSGELGRVQYLYSNRLNIGKIRTEENILWSFAPHDISVMLALLNENPTDLSCRGEDYLNKGVVDVTLSTFRFPSGVRAHIFVSWLHPFKEQRLVVVGSNKMAVFDDTASDKLVLYPHKVEWRKRVPTAVKAESEVVALPEAEPLKNECRHFLECVEKRKQPLTDGEEGLRVLRILSLCQVSLDQKGRPLEYQDASSTPDEQKKTYYAHPTAVIDTPCEIGEGTKIWHFSHIMKNAKLGKRCNLGQNCTVERNVTIGNNVKVQNNVSIYTGVIIEDDVFLGPSCVLTNVTNPRSQITRRGLYETTILKRGCTIGANATIVCGITVGRYAFIGAGAVAAKDVPDYAMMMGVPAKQVGWVSRHGLPLRDPDKDGVYVCPESKLRYKETEAGVLRCIDLDEDEALPEDMRVGGIYYDDIVHGDRLEP
ncbi:MAG: Gfo/Idh/MocA family oxidoreductase [Candidatus Latescibacterota bacterium]|nr:MAG: Gfo/Idh/MocA family oxidoreductase [Candidatus Latescibacterota bacterium]